MEEIAKAGTRNVVILTAGFVEAGAAGVELAGSGWTRSRSFSLRSSEIVQRQAAGHYDMILYSTAVARSEPKDLKPVEDRLDALAAALGRSPVPTVLMTSLAAELLAYAQRMFESRGLYLLKLRSGEGWHCLLHHHRLQGAGPLRGDGQRDRPGARTRITEKLARARGVADPRRSGRHGEHTF